MPSRPSSVGAHVPTPSSSFPPLVWPSMARRRHFCARFQQSGAGLKTRTSVKAIHRPYTAFYPLMAIPIFPRPKTPHIGHQRPAQGIKQPRPAPLWSRPGHYYLLRASESTAQRSAVWSYQAHTFPLHRTPAL